MFDHSSHAVIRAVATALALAAAPFAGAQTAATPAADDGELIGEVTVTAQKREQSIQDVGIAITAFSGEQMQELSMSSAIDIVAQTPGLTVARPGAGAINIFSVRGVTQADFAANQEGPVAVYVDEGYVSQNTVSNFTMFDLERVETLRGPQGTLFGRNATGGLVQYITRKPSQDADGFAEVQLGSQGRKRIESAIGGGLSDRVSARLSAVWNKSDGLMKNTIGKDGQAADDWAVRGQLLWQPSDSVELLLKGEYAKSDALSGSYHHRVALNGEFAPAPATDFFGYRNPDEGNLWKGAWDYPGFNKADVKHGTARLKWNIGAAEIDYIADVQDINHNYGEDSEGSPANVFNYTQSTDVQQWSQELRASWALDKTNLVAGVFFLDIDGDFVQRSLVFGQTDFDWSDAFYGIPEPGG